MTARITFRPLLVLALAFAILLVPFAAPVGIARACGCGAYSPAEGGDASVRGETALVRVDGAYQDTYLSLRLDSDVRTGALLFPVPDKDAKVSAGPRDLFEVLDRLTATRPTGSPGGGTVAGAPRGGVTVQNRQAIGPLDVVTLTSSDPASLTRWLQRNGFAAKPELTRTAAPYVSQGWAFVAVRLRPDAADSTRLDGRLDPLHIRFRRPDTSVAVYPMRLSATATTAQQVTVYTLADRPLDLSTGTPGMARVFSRRIDAGTTGLATVTAGGTTWLTRWDGTVAPGTATDDFRFIPGSATPTGNPTSGDVISPTVTDYYTPPTSYRDLPDAAVPGDGDDDSTAIGVAVGGGLVVLGSLGMVLLARRRGSRGY